MSGHSLGDNNALGGVMMRSSALFRTVIQHSFSDCSVFESKAVFIEHDWSGLYSSPTQLPSIGQVLKMPFKWIPPPGNIALGSIPSELSCCGPCGLRT